MKINRVTSIFIITMLTLQLLSLFTTGISNWLGLVAIKAESLEIESVEHPNWGTGLRAFRLNDDRSRRIYGEMVSSWQLPVDCQGKRFSANLPDWAIDHLAFPIFSWRLLGREATCKRDYNTALAYQQKSFKLIDETTNPLLWVEIGDLYDALSQPSQALEAYEHADYLGRMDQAVVQVVMIARELKESGDIGAAKAILDVGLSINPDNLCLLHERYNITSDGNDVIVAELLDQMVHFNLEALAPRLDSRLTSCDAEAAAALLDKGLWDRETYLAVISYRVWQFPGEETELLLHGLIEWFPQDPDLHFYLGELYQRLGKWENAREAYQRVLSLDSSYALAYYRLGVVQENTCEGSLSTCSLLHEIENNYLKYLELKPDDLLGLKTLVEFYRRINAPEFAQLSSELARRTDDRLIVAELLGMPVDQIAFGPNLIENGGFEDWLPRRPDWWWQWSIEGKDDINRATLVAGADDLNKFTGDNSGRLTGIWIEEQDELKPPQVVFEKNNELSGDRTQFELEPNQYYLFTFYFRKDGILANPWFGTNGNLPFVGLVSLPQTNGQWRKLVVIDKNDSDGFQNIRLVLRLWGRGNAWWDEISFRKLSLVEAKVGIPQEIVWIR